MTFAAFEADRRTNYALVRCLEIIPEASRRLGAEARGRRPHIPPHAMADAGNVYRHSYHRLALDIVWQTVQDQWTEIIEVCRVELSRPPAL